MAVFEHSIEKKNLQSFSSQLKPIAKNWTEVIMKRIK